MKKIMSLILFLLLVLGGFFYYFYSTKPPVPTFPTDAMPELPIRFYSWKEPAIIYTLVPLGITQKQRHVSPNKKYTAELDKKNIIVTNSEGKFVHTILISDGIKDFHYFWINDRFLIVIEKENTELAVDNFYIVDMENGQKQFFTGSFPVKSRLNLEKEIKVYEDGHVLIMEDKTGRLWQLDLMF